MRNAGPCTITAVAAWANVLAASIAQRRAAPTACAGPSVWVTRPSQLSRARRTAPRLVEWCVRKPSADLGLGHAQVDHRASAVEQRDPQGHHGDAELRLLDDVALELRHARDIDDVGVGEALRLAVGGDGAERRAVGVRGGLAVLAGDVGLSDDGVDDELSVTEVETG